MKAIEKETQIVVEVELFDPENLGPVERLFNKADTSIVENIYIGRHDPRFAYWHLILVETGENKKSSSLVLKENDLVVLDDSNEDVPLFKFMTEEEFKAYFSIIDRVNQ